MTAIEWAAIIGAAAWLPHIGTLVVRWLTKPRVKLIPGPQPEIGYTALGPILNFTSALSAERKDAVIESITLEATHERGQVTRFAWSTLNETFSQIRGPEGTAEVTRNQPAIALKVSTLALVEKLIGYQDPEFQENGRALISALGNQNDYLKKTDPDPAKATLRSKQFLDLIEYYQRGFPWQEGRYTVVVTMRLAGVKAPATEHLTFELTPADIDRLKLNLEEIERYLRDTVDPPEEEPHYKWNWINPRLSRLVE